MQFYHGSPGTGHIPLGRLKQSDVQYLLLNPYGGFTAHTDKKYAKNNALGSSEKTGFVYELKIDPARAFTGNTTFVIPPTSPYATSTSHGPRSVALYQAKIGGLTKMTQGIGLTPKAAKKEIDYIIGDGMALERVIANIFKQFSPGSRARFPQMMVDLLGFDAFIFKVKKPKMEGVVVWNLFKITILKETQV